MKKSIMKKTEVFIVRFSIFHTFFFCCYCWLIVCWKYLFVFWIKYLRAINIKLLTSVYFWKKKMTRRYWKFAEFLLSRRKATVSLIQKLQFNFLNRLSLLLFNPFKSNITFLHLLNTSENLWFFNVFRGYRNVTLG